MILTAVVEKLLHTGHEEWIYRLFWMDEIHVHIMAGIYEFSKKKKKKLEAISKTPVSEEWNTGSS